MGNPRFASKQGFKMLRPHKESGINMRTKRHRKDVIEHIPSPSDTGDSPKEHSNVDYEEEAAAKEEEVAYKEPTTYDHLLKMLSGSESFAKAYKKRQREEEGKSDTEEDSVSGFSSSEEEDDSDEGTDKESPRILDMEGSDLAGEHIDNVGHEDEGFSEIDEASDLEADGQLVDSALKASVIMSSFSDHLGHKLSQTEVDNLSKRKWKYKWQMPASDMPTCKWMGTGECLTKDVDLSSGYSLKQRLYKHWLDIYEASGGNDFNSSKQRNFFSLFNSYRDILHHSKKPFYLKGLEEDSNVMDAYLMHSLNHIFRSADLVRKNNAKVAKHQESADGDGFLDQGFTRPKVLILLPLASIAYRVIKRLIQLISPAHKVNVEKLDHFIEKFGAGVADNSEDNEGDVIGNLKSDKTSKPSDFQALFGGNNEDHFMIGIKFTRGRIMLFGDFRTSDMIVASPLGLVTKIGKAQVDKGKGIDYLSSIEVLIIDHADVIAMQNWSHVNTVVEKLNQKPSKQHGTDIMRIRHWFYEGHAQFYRQTIILGAYSNPDINGLFNHHCVNYQGKVKLVCEHKGVLPKVLLQVRQIYERFDAESAVDVDDIRLEYFARKVFPKIKDSTQGGIMLFISSYFEFVRLRNFLKSQDASFCLLGEYTKQADISRARVWFYQGTRKIMLYTERAHFYHRYKNVCPFVLERAAGGCGPCLPCLSHGFTYPMCKKPTQLCGEILVLDTPNGFSLWKIRGIQNLIIYSLPERKEFYPEVVNMLEGSHGMTCTVLFSRFDQLRLERIVGTAPAKRMATSEKGVFAFC